MVVARKRFGQHFLHDADILGRMVAAIDPRPGEYLVEIGPGRGALTTPLLQAAGELDVVELDRDLLPVLERHCASQGTLRIHHQDALRMDFSALAGDRLLRVVGNLPYNISTPLLFHLLEHAERIQDMHFMLQKEVVERMAAPPGSSAYGRLSVMVQYRCTADMLFSVPASAFQPPPKVESAVVRLHPKATLPDADPAQLATVVRQAFSQRRKTLRNSLKSLLPMSAFAAADIDPEARPETLSLDDFIALSRQLTAA